MLGCHSEMGSHYDFNITWDDWWTTHGQYPKSCPAVRRKMFHSASCSLRFVNVWLWKSPSMDSGTVTAFCCQYSSSFTKKYGYSFWSLFVFKLCCLSGVLLKTETNIEHSSLSNTNLMSQHPKVHENLSISKIVSGRKHNTSKLG